MRHLALTLSSVLALLASAQCDRWQQRIICALDVELNTSTHVFSGTERLTYFNNSPDSLDVVYFHLYWNAFQPGSEMDVRSRTIPDPDERVGTRIANLTPAEVGMLHVNELRQGERVCEITELGTVLKVRLAQAVPPGGSTVMDLRFNGQVPIQIRRAGRDNREGISYSMTQWYPKIAAYDQRGWHADPYVAREFYGEWGDFDVHITLDSSFVVAATGVLQNPQEIGHGYEATGSSVQRANGSLLNWHFLAERVHDFGWAADPEYVHVTAQVPDGPLLRFFHQDLPEENEAWKDLPAAMVKSFRYMSAHFGKYPWPVFSFVQGGDGGMEYPMLTLITGKRNPVGVSVHESNHSWFYGLLASNEGRFAWMDEGFTEYASHLVMRMLKDGEGDPHAPAYKGYLQLASTKVHEPMSTHADHFETNFGYGVTAYNKGEMFLAQLRAVVGEKVLAQVMLDYFDACAFKHPEPIDFERVIEKRTGLELDWYFDEWMNTTNTLDYAVDSIYTEGKGTILSLRRDGTMLMPIDVEVETKDGAVQTFHIPLSLMLGAKVAGSEDFTFTTMEPWQWTDPRYTMVLPVDLKKVVRVTVDPLKRLADADRADNNWQR